jgi:hypothetical protein
LDKSSIVSLEPPQGEIKQILPASSNDADSNVQYLKVTGGRWQLSEDPEDRKGEHLLPVGNFFQNTYFQVMMGGLKNYDFDLYLSLFNRWIVDMGSIQRATISIHVTPNKYGRIYSSRE